MSERNTGVGTTIIAFVIGAAAGVATGLLVAPKSGRETREDIKRKTKSGIDIAHDKASHGKEAVKSQLSNAVSTTKTAVTEGRRAAREARERIADQRNS